MSDKRKEALIIGLGRFGRALAGELHALGFDVQAIDRDPQRVLSCMDDMPRVIEADATNPDVLREVGAADVGLAVVAIGEDMAASIMATFELLRLGVPKVVAKAMTESHARILERIGAHRVVFAERDMGVRIAHTIIGSAVDYLELDADYVILETVVPEVMVDKTLEEAQVRSRHGVSVVCIKPQGGQFTHALPTTVPHTGDLVVIAGPPRKVMKFAEMD